MNKFLKEKYEWVLGVLVIVFVGVAIFLLIKTNKLLISNLEKALSLPQISKSSIEFNIQDATAILKKRQLIE